MKCTILLAFSLLAFGCRTARVNEGISATPQLNGHLLLKSEPVDAGPETKASLYADLVLSMADADVGSVVIFLELDRPEQSKFVPRLKFKKFRIKASLEDYRDDPNKGAIDSPTGKRAVLLKAELISAAPEKIEYYAFIYLGRDALSTYKVLFQKQSDGWKIVSKELLSVI